MFPSEEMLHTEIKENPFRLLSVAADGIKLNIPPTQSKGRTLVLDYGHLDSLWESRRVVDENALTHTVNQVWKDRAQPLDHTNEAQYWALVCERERRERNLILVPLADEQASQTEAQDAAGYSPLAGDWRQIVARQIRERRGQQQFRDVLRERHGDCCIVTGCTLLAVLEAAHIKPYQGENDNHPENGLLLRSDIHTLFDLDLLGFEPNRLQVELHPSLVKEYGELSGKVLGCAPSLRPSHEALNFRYTKFQLRLPRCV